MSPKKLEWLKFEFRLLCSHIRQACLSTLKFWSTFFPFTYSKKHWKAPHCFDVRIRMGVDSKQTHCYILMIILIFYRLKISVSGVNMKLFGALNAKRYHSTHYNSNQTTEWAQYREIKPETKTVFTQNGRFRPKRFGAC